MSNVQKLIAVSTAHVPEAVAYPVGSSVIDRAASMSGMHGWLVPTSAELLVDEGEPAGVQVLRDLLFWAQRQGAAYVLFDADAPKLEQFPVYDW